MRKDKKSFFERLTGTIKIDTNEEDNDIGSALDKKTNEWIEEDNGEGQLTVDVFQNPNEIIIKTMVAGVRPDDLDISITRDMVTIKGKREDSREISDDQYFHKELYWGTFSRTILLPEEVEVEGAEATERHGLLTIRLPKVNKEKQTKLRVKTAQ